MDYKEQGSEALGAHSAQDTSRTRTTRVEKEADMRIIVKK